MASESGAAGGAMSGAAMGTQIMPGWGTAIGAVAGGVLGGLGGSDKADEERKAYERASRILGELRGTATQAQRAADPFQQYRSGIATQLADIVSGRRSIETDPGYEFARSEMMRATERGGAKEGMRRSGNILAELQRRAGGLASQQYGNIIQRLQSLSGATPQNAIAGAQLYGGIEQSRIENQARAAVGEGFASGRQRGALWGGAGAVAQQIPDLMSMFNKPDSGGLNSLMIDSTQRPDIFEGTY